MAFEFAGKTWPSVESFLEEFMRFLEKHSRKKRVRGRIESDWNPAYQKFCETHHLSTQQFVEALQHHFHGKGAHRKLWTRARAAWWARRNYAEKRRLGKKPKAPRLNPRPR